MGWLWRAGLTHPIRPPSLADTLRRTDSRGGTWPAGHDSDRLTVATVGRCTCSTHKTPNRVSEITFMLVTVLNKISKSCFQSLGNLTSSSAND